MKLSTKMPGLQALIKEEKKARNADRPALAAACTRVTIRHARKRQNMGNYGLTTELAEHGLRVAGGARFPC